MRRRHGSPVAASPSAAGSTVAIMPTVSRASYLALGSSW